METTKKRHKFSPKQRAKIALEAVREQQTTNQLASTYGCHPSQICRWKKQLLESAPQLFEDGHMGQKRARKTRSVNFLNKLGDSKWKSSGSKKARLMPVYERRKEIKRDTTMLSLKRQCELLGLNRSTLYYEPRPESQEDLRLMHSIDQIYTECPFYGSRRITEVLERKGEIINRKRIQRLMRWMGIEAIYPKPKTSTANPEDKKYPYLLREMKIERPDHVWATDITYIRMQSGFIYLVAIMDWYSRYVLSWRLSNSMDVRFCLDALDEALLRAQPEIFNSDQGSQFTSLAFQKPLTERGVKLSMDGKGRALDNVFVERLWRSLKYEEVYLKNYDTVTDAYEGIGRYLRFYNHSRPHQGLAYRTPAETYFGLKGAVCV